MPQQESLADVMKMTPGRYHLDEVKSALQKSIRRGLEEDALYWAVEFYHADPDVLWERLRIIASEDVGLASPSAAMMVRALYENWKESNKMDEGRLFVVHAVLLLARCKKSRIVDNALIAAFDGELAKRDIPDYAKDKHTSSGRRMGRGYKHFFDEGAKLENCDLPDAYETRARKSKSA